MPERPAPGNFSAYMEFQDGTPATFVYNGYGYFDTNELTSDEGPRLRKQAERATQRAEMRRTLRSNEVDAEAAKEAQRFGSPDRIAERRRPRAGEERPGGFAIIVASYERGDLRHSHDGLFVYDDEGRHHIPVYDEWAVGALEVQQMHEAIFDGKPIAHDGRWGMATPEVATAIIQSSQEHRDITLTHQCPPAGQGGADDHR